jgi:Flp pilus assembly protein TadD
LDILQASSGPGADPSVAPGAWTSGPDLGPTASVLAVPGAACERAEALARAGRGGRALACFRALATDPGCPTALLPRVAAGLAGLGDDASALDVCREAACREPDRPEAAFGLAFAMRRLGYPAEFVIPVADRAVGLAPDFAPSRALLAALLLESGRQGEAEDLLADAPACSTAGACRLGRMIAWFRGPSHP